MKYLIPVDFTTMAYNALNYALDMGNEKDHFVIFHAWESLVTLTEPIHISPALTREQVVDRNLDEMVKNLLSDHPQFVDYNISIKKVMGYPVFAITDELRSGDYDAVIMGTRDKYDLFDKLFGTVSLGVVKKSNVPVYLIPIVSEYEKIDNVLVSTDFHLKSESLINRLIEWNHFNKAALHFLHITEPGQEFGSIKEKLFEELIEKRRLPYNLTFEAMVSDNVVKSLLGKITSCQHDLLIVAPEKQSWIDSLFRRSVSKELILKAKKPMLFMNISAADGI